MNPLECLSKRAVVRKDDQTVEELWGRAGKIRRLKPLDMSNTREWYRRSVESCPDQTLLYLEFDRPIPKTVKNLGGWKGAWFVLSENKLEIEG